MTIDEACELYDKCVELTKGRFKFIGGNPNDEHGLGLSWDSVYRAERYASTVALNEDEAFFATPEEILNAAESVLCHAHDTLVAVDAAFREKAKESAS